MKTDSYTKLLLTIICVCLVYLCLRDFLALPKVRADEPTRVVLVDGGDRPLATGGGSLFRVEVTER